MVQTRTMKMTVTMIQMGEVYNMPKDTEQKRCKALLLHAVNIDGECITAKWYIAAVVPVNGWA